MCCHGASLIGPLGARSSSANLPEEAPSGKKPRGLSGCFGYDKCETVQRITLKGKIDPAWIEGLIQARVDELRAAFDKTYDPHKSLPEWLFDPV